MKSILTFGLLILFGFGCNSENQLKLTEINSPASENSSLPRLFTDNTNTVFLSWIEEQGNMTTLKYAKFDGNNWTSPSVISSDSTWFINWADYPSLIAQNGKPLAAHWLNKVEGGTYAYHVNMAGFDNEWKTAFTPHKDETPTEHGFVSMSPVSDSSFVNIWLDGRHTHNRDNDEYFDLNKAMTLRGALIHTDGEIVDSFLIDDTVCDCCNTSLAKTEKGFIAAYRNRTSEEIRDIYISSFVEGKWSNPKPVYADNWNIAACPVNGPAIDSNGKHVAVAWFTGADGTPKVQMALSEDSGDKFDPPIILDDENPIGRVDLNMTENNIWVSWLTPDEKDASLEIRSYSFDGIETGAYSIPNLSKSRSSGFPHISILGNGLMIAYTDLSGEEPQVKTIKLN